MRTKPSLPFVVGLACASLCAMQTVSAVTLTFDTELLSLSLTGGEHALPLASDPGNALGDSIDGYGYVLSTVSISLSSQRLTPGPASVGAATAFNGALSSTTPGDLHGASFQVDSFFDVFFDITVTDVDARPGRDFAGMADGSTWMALDNMAGISSSYFAIFDRDLPNFGLFLPPEAAPYIGFFNVEVPLGMDINGNDENDNIKFTLGTLTAQDANRTFIILPDGTILDTFDSAASLEGAVVDESTDPPFSFTLSGPATASSKLGGSTTPVPDSGATAWLMSLGLLGLWGCRRTLRSASAWC